MRVGVRGACCNHGTDAFSFYHRLRSTTRKATASTAATTKGQHQVVGERQSPPETSKALDYPQSLPFQHHRHGRLAFSLELGLLVDGGEVFLPSLERYLGRV